MGAQNRIPRKREHFERFKQMVDATVEAEYLYTNDEKVFTGSLREFYAAVWRCERLPLRLRMVAGRELMPTEPPPLQTSILQMTDEELRRAVDEFRAARVLENRAAEHDAKLRELIDASEVSETAFGNQITRLSIIKINQEVSSYSREWREATTAFSASCSRGFTVDEKYGVSVQLGRWLMTEC